MCPEKYSEKAFRLAEEAEDYLQGLDKIEHVIEKNVIDALRKSALEDVVNIHHKVIEDARKEKAESDIYGAYEKLWVYVMVSEDGNRYRVITTSQPTSNMWETAAIYFNEKREPSLPLDDFKNLIENIKENIKSGNLDDLLREPMEKVIYTLMFNETASKLREHSETAR